MAIERQRQKFNPETGALELWVKDSETGWSKVLTFSADGTIPELPTVSTEVIEGAVEDYLVANPVSASWSGLTGKPEVFPPEAHVKP